MLLLRLAVLWVIGLLPSRTLAGCAVLRSTQFVLAVFVQPAAAQQTPYFLFRPQLSFCWKREEDCCSSSRSVPNKEASLRVSCPLSALPYSSGPSPPLSPPARPHFDHNWLCAHVRVGRQAPLNLYDCFCWLPQQTEIRLKVCPWYVSNLLFEALLMGSFCWNTFSTLEIGEYLISKSKYIWSKFIQELFQKLLV